MVKDEEINVAQNQQWQLLQESCLIKRYLLLES